MKRIVVSLVLLSLLQFGWASLIERARAVETGVIHDSSTGALAQGELKSIALTSDGYLLPSYERRKIGDTGAEIVWDAVRDAKGQVVCATGHQGRLVRVTDETTSKVLATLPEPELTAMAKLGDGSILVAAAPTGRIYKLAIDDKVTTWAQLEASFVWRMVVDREGAVWAATGTQGKLFRITQPAGGAVNVQMVHDFRSANLLDLWIDEQGAMGPAGDIYVAGQDPGWLYRFRPSANKTEVVYNTSAEEVRALLPREGGLALALNTERSPTPQAMSLTLRMTGGNTSGPPAVSPTPTPPPSGGGGAPGGGSGPANPAGGPAPDQSGSLSQAFAASPQNNFGAARSEVVLLGKNGFARTLWSSPERPIHDLAAAPDGVTTGTGGILAAVGDQGRVYEITPKGEHAVVADLREDYVTRIKPDGENYLLTTARNGLAFQLGRHRVAEAVFISRAIDGGTPVKWGHFYWHGEQQPGQKVQVAWRTSNDGDPASNLWVDWSQDQETAPDGDGVALDCAPARFLQYRLTLRQDGQTTQPLRLDGVDLYYVEQNAPPRITQIQVSEAPSRGGNAPPPPTPPASGGSGNAPPPPASSAPPGGRALHSNGMIYNINWKVSDQNNDQLRYYLYYRAVDEKEWKLIDDKLRAPQFSLDVGGLTDGRYRFRVVASDQPGNPPGQALTDEAISDEVVVDNTPPVITAKSAEVNGPRATLRVEAADETSLLSAVRVDIDNGDPYPVLPVDGVMDQRHERFEWVTGDLPPGEHVATFSVTDQRGNTAVTKLAFTIAKP